jgi:hypothetical protein
MKKAILILLLTLCTTPTLLAQKKKIKKTNYATALALAKAENVSAEMVGQNLFAIMTVKTKKDSVQLKTFTENKNPIALKIKPFTAKGKKLFLVTWSENTVTTTKLKTEDALLLFSEIINFETKSKVLSNAQTTTNIKEIHYLDSKQTVSETLQKVRREGFELTLNSDGEVSLKNKTQNNKMTFNVEKNTFVSRK